MSGKTERVLARAGESVNRLIGRVLQPPALMQADALAELRAIPDSVLKVLTPEQRDARTIILNMADGGVPLEYGIGEQVDRLGYPPAVAAYARDCASVATTDVPGCRSDIWDAHRVLETDRLADHLKDANGNPAVVAEVTAKLVALGEVSAAAEPLLTAFEEDWFDTPDVPCPCALSGAFPLNDTSILQGKGGFGKSFLSLQFLLSVAIGRELVRGYVPEHGPKPVAFVTLEDRKQSVLERAKKIARAYSFTPEERRLVARNFTIKAQGPPFVPVVRRPDDGTLRAGPDLLRLSGELKKLRPAMVVLDAFFLSHTYEPVDIPSPEAVDRFLPPYVPAFILDTAHPCALSPLVTPNAYLEMRYDIATAMEDALEAFVAVDGEFADIFGRRYGAVEEIAGSDADTIFVTSGTVTSTARMAVEELRARGG